MVKNIIVKLAHAVVKKPNDGKMSEEIIMFVRKMQKLLVLSYDLVHFG